MQRNRVAIGPIITEKSYQGAGRCMLCIVWFRESTRPHLSDSAEWKPSLRATYISKHATKADGAICSLKF
jgi:hypothetical protein